MIINKPTPHDNSRTVARSYGEHNERVEKMIPNRFTWLGSEAIPIGTAELMVTKEQINKRIADIISESDQAFVKISVNHPGRYYEIKRLPIPSFDLLAFEYEPEMPPGVKCENIEQFLKFMFSRASSVSIMVSEKSSDKWKIVCVDVEYKQTNHNSSMKKDGR